MINNKNNSGNSLDSDDAINLVLVSCGSKDRLEEVEVLLKSAVAFSRQKVNFIVFTDSLGKEVSTTCALFFVLLMRPRLDH